MRTMIHLGETLPDEIKDAYQLSGKVLALWAFTIFSLMLATFGIGAASGTGSEILPTKIPPPHGHYPPTIPRRVESTYHF